MNRPAAVSACITCGALYTRAPNDGGLCEDCRIVPASGVAWDPNQAKTPPAPARPSPAPARAPVSQPAPRMGAAAPSVPQRSGQTASGLRVATAQTSSAGSALRARSGARRGGSRAAIFAAVALLVVGSGAWWISTHGQTLSRTWLTVRRHAAADAWTPLRRHALEAWDAIRSRLPFEWAQAKQGGAATAAPSKAPGRETTASHATHRRSKGH